MIMGITPAGLRAVVTITMSGEQPKVKYSDPKRQLRPTQVDFMRLIEQQNLERVQKLKKTRKNNLITALSLGGTCIAIYAYSMLAVKQEKFLDDFEEPAKVLKEN
ncbi:cytochrome c oxidase assembly factor 3, mitochondrial [Phlebotomus argentipes]|uniref:cytochrome c oxidase assembly factor 3, mitochondrial n=1 Tax=Phlebotomus argentipes TaxID=94469 RepID=UPI002892CBA6|nr:cytochrome c oxidase assembly factor 3, mitochondrial [Phlebotomus argentipes]